MPIEAIPMSQSRTKTTKLVMPPDTNHHGTIFGGQVLSYLDEISAIAAMKHAGAAVVTASIDSVDFVSPATVGEVLEIEAVVTSTGRTSMEVFVTVHSIDLLSSARKLTTESFVTMVAMDEENRPTPVAPVYPETKAEKALYDKAPARRANRKERMAIKDAL
ncbi:acyl-CoA thioesterase [Edaphobacillus lindanitolerans]|uniref:Acyl-CoA hydrolase n=1 Tax=Edaphobacillus lindanitolerans TaxID=550447 RepID=A0A1U7PQY3_9BACI|nr:acyl-CoA thioesterase [Edaphobacillus lindanitolerans]SIT87197.1 Acyl-CoA hydrolase [Edaphobacillus lindanitolerans]